MVETCKKTKDQRKKYDAMLIDHSRAFDRFTQDLVHCNCKNLFRLFLYRIFELRNDYKLERKQWVKINNQFSLCKDILLALSKGSILGPL